MNLSLSLLLSVSLSLSLSFSFRAPLSDKFERRLLFFYYYCERAGARRRLTSGRTSRFVYLAVERVATLLYDDTGRSFVSFMKFYQVREIAPAQQPSPSARGEAKIIRATFTYARYSRAERYLKLGSSSNILNFVFNMAHSVVMKFYLSTYLLSKPQRGSPTFDNSVLHTGNGVSF